MKKLSLLFIAIITTTFFSCDSDESINQPIQTKNFVKANIDGVEINFDKIVVEQKAYPDATPPYTDLHVTATKSNDPTKSITLDLAALEVGDNTTYYFVYFNDAKEYYYDRDAEDGVHNKSFIISLLDNTSNNIKGSFEGKIYEYDNIGSATIFNGSFDITF